MKKLFFGGSRFRIVRADAEYKKLPGTRKRLVPGGFFVD
jgi:hypothetical protein